MDSSKTIYVYDCFSSSNSILLGYLYVDVIRGEETYSFEFNKEWLKQNITNPQLDPSLNMYLGRQYPKNKNIFGIFADASPDRWGRVLINKRERFKAGIGNKPRALYDSDYLLEVNDLLRMGGLRFKLNIDDDFVSTDLTNSIPPWASLRNLEEACRNYENNDNLTDIWIKQLLSPGSSLGGARPKACVCDTNNELWIAKFPSKYDEFNIGAWEKVVSDLAKMCGLNVPESRLENFSPYGSTFIVKRFDRVGEKRIHFASAMTLLGKTDGDYKIDGASYLDIASFIKSYGCSPKEDLLELWKRIVFSMAISNTDDHLRNHAFIYTAKGWKLSPLYDVNPTPYGNELSLNVNEYLNTIDFKLALEVSNQFMIEKSNAEAIINITKEIINKNWINLALKYNISKDEIEQMRPAFHLIN